MGALSNQLYTMIVAMAVVTTMAMPPTLRWMMARVPMREDEATGGRPGGHDDDASASKANDQSAEGAGGHTIPIEDEGRPPGTEPGEDHELQEENAETSQD